MKNTKSSINDGFWSSPKKTNQTKPNQTKTIFCSFFSLIIIVIFFGQADLNTNIEDESRSFYGVSSQYESPENMVITCSTKVCSFGKQVVEKVEVRSRHLCTRFSLAAVLLFQVFVCWIYQKVNISHTSRRGDGCHRLFFLKHEIIKLFQPPAWHFSRLDERSDSVLCFFLKSQFLKIWWFSGLSGEQRKARKYGFT